MGSKEYFDQSANTWDEMFLTPILSAFLEKLVPQFRLEPRYAVLDVGTGTGVLIQYLVKAVGSSGEITAIDYSKKMVNVCRTKYSHLKNVKIKIGNIEEDIFPSETFDAITCFGVFPHIDNKHKVLQKMNCALKQGGKLVIAHALSSKELKNHHKKASKQVAHAMLPTKTKMVQLLKHADFKEISIKDEPGCYLCISHKS